MARCAPARRRTFGKARSDWAWLRAMRGATPKAARLARLWPGICGRGSIYLCLFRKPQLPNAKKPHRMMRFFACRCVGS